MEGWSPVLAVWTGCAVLLYASLPLWVLASGGLLSLAQKLVFALLLSTLVVLSPRPHKWELAGVADYFGKQQLLNCKVE